MKKITFINLIIVVCLLAGCQTKDEKAVADKMVKSPAMGQTMPALPALPSGNITGKLILPEQFNDKITKSDTIYIIARHAVSNSALAVLRLQMPEKFPFDFVLTGKNVMHSDGTLAGKVKLEARIDKDGDAMTKKPGDLLAVSKDLIQVPAQNITLTFEQIL